MKKIMIAMLLTMLSFNIANVTAATQEETKKYEESINFVQNDFSDKNSYTIFGEIDAKGDTKIEYSYEEIELKDNSSLVVFNGIIDNQGEKLPIYAEGEVDHTQLSKGETYLSGSLRGAISNGRKTFEVAIGFSGMKETEEVSFGVTVYTSKEKCYDSILFFSFGKQKLTENTIELLSKPTLDKSSQLTEQLVIINQLNEGVKVGNPFVYEGYDYAYQDSSCNVGHQPQSEKLLRLRTYKDEVNERIGVTLKTYTNNFDIDELYSPSDPYPHSIIGAYVDSYKVELERLSSGGIYIDGMERVKVSQASSNTLLEAVFQDFVGIYAPGGETLNHIFDNSRGSVSFEQFSDYYSVDVNVSNTQSAKLTFDNDQFFVVFQLDTNNNVMTSFRAYGSVTYFVYTDYCLFIVDTERAWESLGFIF